MFNILSNLDSFLSTPLWSLHQVRTGRYSISNSNSIPTSMKNRNQWKLAQDNCNGSRQKCIWKYAGRSRNVGTSLANYPGSARDSRINILALPVLNARPKGCLHPWPSHTELMPYCCCGHSWCVAWGCRSSRTSSHSNRCRSRAGHLCGS